MSVVIAQFHWLHFRWLVPVPYIDIRREEPAQSNNGGKHSPQDERQPWRAVGVRNPVSSPVQRHLGRGREYGCQLHHESQPEENAANTPPASQCARNVTVVAMGHTCWSSGGCLQRLRHWLLMKGRLGISGFNYLILSQREQSQSGLPVMPLAVRFFCSHL